MHRTEIWRKRIQSVYVVMNSAVDGLPVTAAEVLQRCAKEVLIAGAFVHKVGDAVFLEVGLGVMPGTTGGKETR